jgi:flagellar FliL protein
MVTNSALKLAVHDSNSARSIFPWVVTMFVLTAVAGGAGTLLGLRLVTLIRDTNNAEKRGASASPEDPKFPSALTVFSLPPVVSNLASSTNLWVRLEGAILYDKDKVQTPEILASRISEDIFGFLKTLSLDDISGPSGLQHLREDLNERAVIRSEGKVRELFIQSLVIQ